MPGSGTVVGTLKHTKFADLVDNAGMKNVFTEVSYKNGNIVPFGTKGSVRLDVVQYNSKRQIIGVWDLKTVKQDYLQAE